jgi:putative SOS response-associated peptidase YedK
VCGRAILVATVEVLEDIFGLTEAPDLVAPRFNIAPSQPIALIREPHRLELVRWGLVLPGAKAPKINLRAESVANNPATRDLARSRRCLVIVDGFYEWKREGKTSRPFLLQHPDGKPFALGGIWSRSAAPDGSPLDTCAILTRGAEGAVRALHDRMPFVVPPDAYAQWIDPSAKVVPLLAAPADTSFVAREVSARVSSPANDDAKCIEPPDAEQTLFTRVRPQA